MRQKNGQKATRNKKSGGKKEKRSFQKEGCKGKEKKSRKTALSQK